MNKIWDNRKPERQTPTCFQHYGKKGRRCKVCEIRQDCEKMTF